MSAQAIRTTMRAVRVSSRHEGGRNHGKQYADFRGFTLNLLTFFRNGLQPPASALRGWGYRPPEELRLPRAFRQLPVVSFFSREIYPMPKTEKLERPKRSSAHRMSFQPAVPGGALQQSPLSASPVASFCNPGFRWYTLFSEWKVSLPCCLHLRGIARLRPYLGIGANRGVRFLFDAPESGFLRIHPSSRWTDPLAFVLCPALVRHKRNLVNSAR